MPVELRRRLTVVETWCRGRFWPARALLLVWFVYVGVRHLADPLYTSLFGALNRRRLSCDGIPYNYFITIPLIPPVPRPWPI